MTGENLDLTSEPGKQPTRDGSEKRFLGVHFACCGVYCRVYVNRDKSAYVGYCPKGSRPVRIGIGPGGTKDRFFTAH